MRSVRKGYISVDHRASPPDVQQQFGRHNECDFVLCSHCQAIIKLIPGVGREFCFKCGRLICGLCYEKGKREEHQSFMQKVDAQLRANRLMQQLGGQ